MWKWFVDPAVLFNVPDSEKKVASCPSGVVGLLCTSPRSMANCRGSGQGEETDCTVNIRELSEPAYPGRHER